MPFNEFIKHLGNYHITYIISIDVFKLSLKYGSSVDLYKIYKT